MSYAAPARFSKCMLMLAAFLFPFLCSAQNLVLNPGFSEVHDPERDFIGNGITNANDWQGINTVDYIYRREVAGHKPCAGLFLAQAKEYLIGRTAGRLEQGKVYTFSLAAYTRSGGKAFKSMEVVFLTELPAFLQHTEFATQFEMDDFVKKEAVKKHAFEITSRQAGKKWATLTFNFIAAEPYRYFIVGNYGAEVLNGYVHVDDFDLRAAGENEKERTLKVR